MHAESPGIIDAALDYIDQYWNKIIRQNSEDNQTLIGLPYPYLVPSDGAMFQEMYYWDSYFMSLGILGTAHEDLIVGMTYNLAHLQKRFGLIPNGSRYYFLSRSQPPFFTKMVRLAYDVMRQTNETGALSFLKEMILVAENEHETVWLGSKQPHHRLMKFGLSRYFDINFLDMLASCESGWDHSTRCEDRWMQHLPIDLNCILYARELDFAEVFALLGEQSKSQYWLTQAKNRAATINSKMWDPEKSFYFDYDLHNDSIETTTSLAGFFPLWAGLASQSQAASMIETWLPQFEFDGGLVTSLDTEDGRQWAFPNGWAPLQWLVAEGLDRYGFHQEATRIRAKWLGNCLSVFNITGVMWEKYNVVTPGVVPEHGLYGSIPGFGWTNAIFVDFLKKFESSASGQNLTMTIVESISNATNLDSDIKASKI